MADKSKFWIVCNFNSDHWPMNEARRCDTEKEAIDYAKKLAAKYPTHEYHILKTSKLVRATPVPLQVIAL